MSVSEDLAKVFLAYGPWTTQGVLDLCQAIFEDDRPDHWIIPTEVGLSEGRITGEDGRSYIYDSVDVFITTMGKVWHLIPLGDLKELRSMASEEGPRKYLTHLTWILPAELDSMSREGVHDCLMNADISFLLDILSDYHERVACPPRPLDPVVVKRLRKALMTAIGTLRELPSGRTKFGFPL